MDMPGANNEDTDAMSAPPDTTPPDSTPPDTAPQGTAPSDTASVQSFAVKYGLRKRTYYEFKESDDECSPAPLNKYRALIEEHKALGTFNQYRWKENERLRNFRKTRQTPEAKAKARERSRLSMQKWRKNQKEQETLPMTRSGMEKKAQLTASAREKRRKYMRERRAKMTPEEKQKESDRKKEIRRRKAESKKKQQEPRGLAGQQQAPRPEELQTPSGSPYKTSNALRIASLRASTSDPDDPVKLASVRIHQLKRDMRSPRKARAFKRLGFDQLLAGMAPTEKGFVQRVKDRLTRNKKKRDEASITTQKRLVREVVAITAVGSVNEVARNLGITWRFAKNAMLIEEQEEFSNSFKNNAVGKELDEAILEFYDRPEVATAIPDKKAVKKDLVPKAVLNKTLRALHKEFVEETRQKVSLSKFQKMRPQRVMTMSHRKKTSCLCIYCANTGQKLNALRKAFPGKVAGDVEEAVAQTVCSNDPKRHHRPACIARECPQCGVDFLRQELLAKLPSNQSIEWLRWQTCSKGEEGRTCNITKKGSVAELIEELMVELKPMASHLHVARWQYVQFRTLKLSLPPNWLMTMMDFAENFRCEFQDEVQSAHWSYNQVTVFPTVNYYRCSCGEVVTETIVIISPDQTHDASAVFCFSSAVAEQLISERKLRIDHQVQFTDGAASQFKSREPFQDISMSFTDFGFTVERSFFGSYHGKGPCDGAGGMVKSATRRAVLANQVMVRNAKEMHEFLVKKYTIDPETTDCATHQKRVFLYKDEVKRQRSDRRPNNPLPGTRKVHSVKAVGPCIVETTTLSCFCEGCLLKQECLNMDVVGKATRHAFYVPAFERQEASRRRQATSGGDDEVSLLSVGISTLDRSFIYNASTTDGAAFMPDLSTTVNSSAQCDTSTGSTEKASGPSLVETRHEQESSTGLQNTTTNAATGTESTVKNGDFVQATVYAESGVESKQFVGCVKRLRPDKGGVEISFLKKLGGSYQFPDIPDEALVLLQDICCVLDAHVDRRGHYTFNI